MCAVEVNYKTASHPTATRVAPLCGRAGAIGLCSDVDQVIRYADIQARVTHATPLGIESAQAAALAVHYCRYNIGPVSNIGAWIDAEIQEYGGLGGWARVWNGPVGSRGWMSVLAALTALSAASSLSDLLTRCVNYTGDVDTVATIALAAASCTTELVADLPHALLRDLENGPYGHDYLTELDKVLFRVIQ
ncbi:ADP-ribosylglycohydrolase family protein [Fodinicola feengrottensis]|uniref:ADP-ribosylglycohydrolase family protein n=1 Tax=Fodinicola feengrottensis TaxID=435914 RepID=UPI0036F33BEB